MYRTNFIDNLSLNSSHHDVSIHDKLYLQRNEVDSSITVSPINFEQD